MTSIGTRVLAYGLAMAWLPLILFGGFVTFTVKPQLEATAADKTANTAVNHASAVNQVLLNVAGGLETVAKTRQDQLLFSSVASRTETLVDVLKLSPLLEEIYLFDHFGSPLDWVSRRRITALSKPDSVSHELYRTPFITNLSWERDGRLTAILCVPVSRPGSKAVSGYLGGKLGLRSVTDLTLLPRSGHGHVFIIDSAGNLVGHEDFSQVLGRRDVTKSRTVQLFREQSVRHVSDDDKAPVLASAEPLRYISYSGQEVLGVYAPIGPWGWAVVVEQDISLALAPAGDWVKRLVGFGVLLSLFALLLSYYISVRITRPLRSLEEGVAKAAHGEWEQDLPAAGYEELDRLTRSFNDMLAGQRQKKELEYRLAQADKMASLGTVASSIAHEINNPLAVISGYSEDLLDRLATEPPGEILPEANRYLGIILQQTQRCKTITRSLLDTARIPDGRGEWTDAIQSLEAVREMLLYRAKTKKVFLENIVAVPPSARPVIWIDRSEFQQILLNIFINAYDACREGDRIITEVDTAEGICRISITDTGIGIAAENLALIGKSFFTTKPPGQGTGLGLFIVRQILDRWGGTFTIASDGLEKGSRVTLELPAGKEVPHG